jgi:hypothetical protein
MILGVTSFALGFLLDVAASVARVLANS